MMAHLKLPRIEDCAELLAESKMPETVLAVVVAFQRSTVLAMADCMITAARQMELTNKTLTFDDLKNEGIKLKELAGRIGQ